MNQTEIQQVRVKFAEFLSQHYEFELLALSNNYPSETSIEFEWDTLVEFNPDLASDYELHEKVREEATEALRFHEAIEGAAYLPKARLVPADPPEIVNVDELKSAYNGSFIGVKGKVAEANPYSQHVETAVYYCQACGSMNTVDAKTRGRVEPYQCVGCEKKRVGYDFDYDESTFYDAREIQLQPVSRYGNSISAPWTVTVELLDEAALQISPGDWVVCTGTLTFEFVDDNSNRVLPAMEAVSVEEFDPGELVDDERQKELLRHTDHDLTRDHVLGYTTHVEDILSSIDDEREFSEEDVKTKLITPMLELLQWDPLSNEVLMEYKTGDGEHRVDYLLKIDDEPMIAVEAKSLTAPVARSGLVQLDRYVAQSNADWGLLTNGKRYRLIENPDNRDRYNPHVEGHIIMDTTYELLSEFMAEMSFLARSTYE